MAALFNALKSILDCRCSSRWIYKLVILTVVSIYGFGWDIFSSCYEYETYCLFSFGPNVTVNNVKEAQKICEDAKRGSWLLEIVEIRDLKNVDEFLSNHSFSKDTKLILSAKKVENKWTWIKSESDINSDVFKITKLSENVMYYQKLMTGSISSSDNQFAVVCAIGCYSKLETLDNNYISFGTYNENATRDQCWELCERSNCELWNWETRISMYGCWYISPSGTGNVSVGSSNTLYKLDRSAKTTDKCVGYIAKFPNLTTDNSDEMERPNTAIPTLSKLILVHIIPLILLLAINISVAIMFWRKLKKRQEVSHGVNYLRSETIISGPHEYDEIDHRLSETIVKTAQERNYIHLFSSL